MAAYKADIEIGVVGVRALEQLRSQINQTAQAVDSLNDVVGARGGLVQSINNYVNNLNRAAVSLERVGAGTEAETKAVREYVKALGEANTARARQNALVAQEIANQRRINPSTAPFGQQGPALPPATVKGQEIQQAWNKFFAEAAEVGKELQTTAAAKSLNIKTNWNTFFAEAAEVGRNLQVTTTAKTLNLKTNWSNFFAEAAEVGKELQTTAAAKSLNIKTNWNNFFTEAQELAQDLLRQTQQAAAAVRARESAASSAARERLAAESEKRAKIQNAGFGVQGPQPLGVKGLGPDPTLKQINQYIQQLNTFIENVPFKSELYQRGIEQLKQVEAYLGRGSAKETRPLKTAASVPETGASTAQRVSRTGGGPFTVDQPFDINDLKKAKATRALEDPGVLDAILGGGFPLLFGGGPGATLGGVAGGLIGGKMGGMAGMALSIGLSALGQKFDQIFGEAIKATQELGQALSRLDVEKLRESSVFVTAELDNQVRLLMEAGKYDEARAVAIKETTAQTGALGSTVLDSANATNLLKNAWDNVLKPVQSILSSLAAPFVAALAGILNIVGLIAKGVNVVLSGIGQLVKGAAEWLIKLVGGQAALDRIKQLTGAASEETERLRAASEAATDASVRDVQLKKQLLDLERARVEGSNRLAQQSQIDAAFTREKLTAEKELADEIKRINREGAQLTEQQRALEIAIAQAKTEQKIDEAAITKEKAQQRLLNDAIIAGLQDQANALQTQADQYAKAQASTASILQIELQRFQQRAQFVTSLNQEATLINQIAANRKKAAEIEYQAAVASANSAVQQAAAEYEIVKAKYEQNNADIEQVNAAQRKLQTAIQARGLDVEIAGLKRQQAVETAELERRQAQVNAYAEEYARINERTTRQLEEQTNALSNRASLTAAISQAVQTINNLEIEGLTRELERTSSTERRAQIIDRIYKLEIENARVALEATRAQINAELARAEAAYRTVQLKYEELRAVVQIAEAEGVANRAHYAALEAQGSALRIAKDNLATAGQVAQWQWKAANAVFKAAVDAAQLKKEMSSAAGAAGQFAGSMERAANATQRAASAAQGMGKAALGATSQGAPFAAMGGAEAIQDPKLKAEAIAIWTEAERFAATKFIPSIQEDIYQRARNYIAQIAAKDYVQRNPAPGNFFGPQGADPLGDLNKVRDQIYTNLGMQPPQSLSAPTPSTPSPPIPTTGGTISGLSRQPGGAPGTAIIGSFPEVPTTINLQTGPVLQQDDGKKYVSLSDLEKILQDFAAVVFNNARTAGGRRFQGVA